MATLDAHPWAGGVSLVSYGVRLGVRVDDAALLEQLPLYLPPVRTRPATPGVDHLFSLCTTRRDGRRHERSVTRVYDGHRIVARRSALGPSMQLDLLRSCLEFHIASTARSWLFVHAGVVEWRGRAILIPGRSRSGKTTLVTALIRAGAGYYSDEFAVLDRFGRVHPWARPLRSAGRAGCHNRTRWKHWAAWPAGGRPRRACRGDGLPRRGALAAACPVARPDPARPDGEHPLARSRPELTLAILARAARARARKGWRDEAEALAATLLADASVVTIDRNGHLRRPVEEEIA
ncbi:MAG: hypothetical protein U0587_05160 [Candidatus Binatia bacterium]